MQSWLEQLSELLKKDQTHLRALETLLEERISALVTQSFSEVFEEEIC
jgi:flagellar biosynthesis/type III secretory pathway chaperone